MDYYHKYLKYKEKYLKIKFQKGSGNIQDACTKYNHPKTNIMPPSVTTEETGENDSNYESLYKFISDPDFINPELPLILKIGSNDDPLVIGGKLPDPLNNGSKGTNGNIFFEIPSKSPDNISENITITSDHINKNSVVDCVLQRTLYTFIKSVKRVFNDNIQLITVSPTVEYPDYWYPFGILGGEDDIDNIYLSPLASIQSSPQYIKGYFPIGINNDLESVNNKILTYLITRPGPLLLFNAMGSTCYQSIKYIIDMRLSLDKITFYGGLVDDSEDASCEINSRIYPDPEEACKDL